MNHRKERERGRGRGRGKGRGRGRGKNETLVLTFGLVPSHGTESCYSLWQHEKKLGAWG